MDVFRITFSSLRVFSTSRSQQQNYMIMHACVERRCAPRYACELYAPAPTLCNVPLHLQRTNNPAPPPTADELNERGTVGRPTASRRRICCVSVGSQA
eukprot:4408550-Prymnesium_polylepis.1